MDGPISDRLREQYGDNVGDWPAFRKGDSEDSLPFDPRIHAGIDLDPAGRGMGGQR